MRASRESRNFALTSPTSLGVPFGHVRRMSKAPARGVRKPRRPPVDERVDGIRIQRLKGPSHLVESKDRPERLCRLVSWPKCERILADFVAGQGA